VPGTSHLLPSPGPVATGHPAEPAEQAELGKLQRADEWLGGPGEHGGIWSEPGEKM